MQQRSQNVTMMLCRIERGRGLRQVDDGAEAPEGGEKDGVAPAPRSRRAAEMNLSDREAGSPRAATQWERTPTGRPLPLRDGQAAVRDWRAPGGDEDSLDGKADGLPYCCPMLRGVAWPRPREVAGGQCCAGGLKRSRQRAVRDVHIQDDWDS